VSWAEEAVLVATFLAAFLTVRGLYGVVPFLLSLGIAAIAAFLCLVAVRLVTRSGVSLASWRLKRQGGLTAAGRTYCVVMAMLLLLWTHSALIRWSEAEGDRLYRRTAPRRAAALDLDRSLVALEGAELEGARKAMRHLLFSQRWGLVSNPGAHLKLAWLSVLTGRRDGYHDHMAAALEAQPFSAELHLLRGRELADRGLVREAALAYVAAVESSPEAAVGYDSLGTLTARAGDLGRAGEVFERGIAASPGSASLRYNSGVALALAGDLAGAIRRFEEALDRDPDHIRARENLAGALIAAGRPVEAVEHLQVATRLAPGDATTRLALARALMAAGDGERARAEAGVALELDPTLTEAAELASGPGAGRAR
jgi:tetratricopeptide (TPR) repeat protein